MAEAITYKPIPELNKNDYTRFWSKVTLTANPEKCWEWKAGKNTGGYGSFGIGPINYTSNRVAYFLYHKIDPKKFHVLHKCDNRGCVNPNHLFLGTNYDNVKDKMAKGRQGRPVGVLSGAFTHPEKILKGSKNGASKLNEEKVVKIRQMYAEGNISTYKIAEIYGVSQAVIWYALNRKSWKHI